MNEECARAQGMLPAYLDSELSPPDAAWLSEHSEQCADCRRTLADFTAIDTDVQAWGRQVGAALRPRKALVWMPAAVTLLAAALLLALVAPRGETPAVARDDAPLVAIPYLPPLDPHENAAVVRMNLPVATLMRLGYRVTGDPETMMAADVLVGEDGRAHAVRVVADNGRN